MCYHSACKLGFPIGHSSRRLNSPSRQDRTACQMHKGVLAKVVVCPFVGVLVDDPGLAGDGLA